AVDPPPNGLNPEVGVTHRPIARQLHRLALDVEAVISRAPGDVALEEAVAGLPYDLVVIPAAVSDQVVADGVVGAAEERVLDSETDARMVCMGDEVVGDEVAVPLLDSDPVASVEDAVSLDHVLAAGPEGDPAAVSNQAVMGDPV